MLAAAAECHYVQALTEAEEISNENKALREVVRSMDGALKNALTAVIRAQGEVRGVRLVAALRSAGWGGREQIIRNCLGRWQHRSDCAVWQWHAHASAHAAAGCGVRGALVLLCMLTRQAAVASQVFHYSVFTADRHCCC